MAAKKEIVLGGSRLQMFMETMEQVTDAKTAAKLGALLSGLGDVLNALSTRK